MLSKLSQMGSKTFHKGIETMKSHYSVTPWGLRLGILGLALSASPLSMNCAYAKVASAKAGVVKADSSISAKAPDPTLDPLDKVAAARIPEGRVTVTNIEGALEAAYRNNSELKEYQAQLRSRDEGVPQALAGWRPTVYLNASIGGEKDIKSGTQKDVGELNSSAQSGSNFSTASADIALQQNLFYGGKTVAETCKAENTVLAARAQLADKEREVLFAAVKAYFEVIAKTSELAYRKSTELAFKKTLEATQDKFNVGEETRTSIAQAQADLANAIAQRESTEAQLLAAEATFEQVTGARPGKLKKPGDLSMLPTGLKEAIEIAKKNNPAILTVVYQERADRQAIKSSDADLLPKVDLQASVGRQATNNKTRLAASNTNVQFNDFVTAQKIAVVLKTPLYEGGEFRARTRGLREAAEQRRIMIETARRKVIQQLVAAWELYTSSKANVKSYETQVKANEVALEGTRQEMLVGSKILLDVLNAQRLLVQSQLNLVQAEQQFYQAAYDILANMGRLNAMDMKLKVKRYNTQVHYQDVRNSW